MTSRHEAAINAMMADLHKQRDGMVRLHQSLANVTGTATSPRRQLTVTVDSRGELTELKFHGNVYRTMAAEELASMIIGTIREAQAAARRTVWEQVGDFGPPGADLAAFAEGNLDWQAAFAESFTLPQPLLDLIGSPPSSLFGDVNRSDGGESGPSTDTPRPPRRD